MSNKLLTSVIRLGIVFAVFAIQASFSKVFSQDLAEKYYMKGVEFQNKSVYSRAVDYFDMAARQRPGFHKAKYQKTFSLFRLKKYDEALAEAVRLLDLYPADGELHALAAMAAIAAGQPSRAFRYIDQALLIENLPVHHLRKAMILYSSGRYGEVFTELTAAAVEEDLLPAVLELKAMTYHEMGRDNQALQAYNRLVPLTPRPELYYNRGLLRRKLGDYQSACSDFAKAAEAPDFESAHVALVRTLWHLGRIDQVQKKCLDGILHFPTNPVFYLYSGLVELRQGKFENALGWFDKAEKLGMNTSDLYINRGLAYLAIDPSKSEQCFEKAVRMDPLNATARRNLALLRSH